MISGLTSPDSRPVGVHHCICLVDKQIYPRCITNETVCGSRCARAAGPKRGKARARTNPVTTQRISGR